MKSELKILKAVGNYDSTILRPIKQFGLATMTARDILKWTNLPELRITQIAGMTVQVTSQQTGICKQQFIDDHSVLKLHWTGPDFEIVRIPNQLQYQGHQDKHETVLNRFQPWFDYIYIYIYICICICICMCICIYVTPGSCCVHGCIHFFRLWFWCGTTGMFCQIQVGKYGFHKTHNISHEDFPFTHLPSVHLRFAVASGIPGLVKAQFTLVATANEQKKTDPWTGRRITNK